MLGDTAVSAAASAEAHEVGGGGGNGGGGSNSGEEGDRSFGGNRWPRQETLALLKIRSEMDLAFKDATVKGPLWDEVSRKMAELGYNRNSKKCKEKFENVYKYHKRTKEGRGGKSDGKTYRFFDQLQALENNPSNIQIQSPTTPSNSKPLQAQPVTTIVTTLPLAPPLITPTPPTTIPSPTPPISLPHTSLNNPTYFPPQQQPSSTTPMAMPIPNPTPASFPNNIPTDFFSNSSSSSTSSEEITTAMEGENRRKRKRKWKDFFERLMKEVMEKQEELHQRFLEAIEKREKEHAAREEAWRLQEMQRINREREILAQERSIAAAKDSAVMAFLQKIAEQQQQNLGPSLNNNNNISIPQQQQQPQIPQQPQMPQETTAAQVTPSQVLVTPSQVINTPPPSVQQAGPVTIPPAPPEVPQQQQQLQVQQQPVQQQWANMEIIKGDNGENVMTMGASPSRWPKTEVEALIKLRTSLETKYQENAPKGPLWEEISSLMKKMGYNRNPKRCKEKWENINKYFKKVKESNKKRPEDSKTCPYFNQLDALYREKNKMESGAKPEGITMAPLMVRPEQQWPPQQQPQQQQQQTVTVKGPDVTMEDAENEKRQRDEEDFYDDNDEDDKDAGDDDDEDEEDETGGNYEVVASKPSNQ